jgi:hypothetical protein
MLCVQGRLSDAAAAAVKDLLPSYAGNNLSSLCSWADNVRFRYHWASPLHYIDTPDGLCNYSYDSKHNQARRSSFRVSETDAHANVIQSFRVSLFPVSSGDCKDVDGVKGRCVAGAINNYTSQLLTYGKSSATQCNLLMLMFESCNLLDKFSCCIVLLTVI